MLCFPIMTWRKFHWLLFLVVVVVAIIRIMTGNLLGALVPIVMAIIFASIAADYPLVSRVKQTWSMARRLLGVKKRS